ncbi:hypothetical protein BS78_08G001200 [Paspalum vaginatum]|nr:hypothetical protein BS78_08G001200 [Paspalum vaginatum]
MEDDSDQASQDRLGTSFSRGSVVAYLPLGAPQAGHVPEAGPPPLHGAPTPAMCRRVGDQLPMACPRRPCLLLTWAVSPLVCSAHRHRAESQVHLPCSTSCTCDGRQSAHHRRAESRALLGNWITLD